MDVYEPIACTSMPCIVVTGASFHSCPKADTGADHARPMHPTESSEALNNVLISRSPMMVPWARPKETRVAGDHRSPGGKHSSGSGEAVRADKRAKGTVGLDIIPEEHSRENMDEWIDVDTSGWCWPTSGSHPAWRGWSKAASSSSQSWSQSDAWTAKSWRDRNAWQ